MAEFLIKARDPIDLPADQQKRDRCWRRGDVVVVMPDGHEWGREERLPKFIVVKIPGMPIDIAKKYEGAFEKDIGLLNARGDKIIKVVSRAKCRLLVDAVPSSIKTSLRDTGTITISWVNVKGFFQDKETLT